MINFFIQAAQRLRFGWGVGRPFLVQKQQKNTNYCHDRYWLKILYKYFFYVHEHQDQNMISIQSPGYLYNYWKC